MPFGLKNAPAIFSRLMSNVLAGLIGPSVLVYLDDIIIFSETLDEHLDKLKKVFGRLREYNLKLKLKKCQFLCDLSSFWDKKFQIKVSLFIRIILTQYII